MELKPLYIKVLPKLNETGSCDKVQGVMPLASIDVGFRHFTVSEGIAYDVSLVNTSEAVLVSGKATALLATPCDRCLEDTELSLSGEIQGYYLFDPIDAPGTEQLEVYEMVDTEGRIDLAPPILAAIVYELPPVTHCRSDCEGIPLEAIEDADPVGIEKENPFAALKDFKFDQ